MSTQDIRTVYNILRDITNPALGAYIINQGKHQPHSFLGMHAIIPAYFNDEYNLMLNVAEKKLKGAISGSSLDVNLERHHLTHTFTWTETGNHIDHHPRHPVTLAQLVRLAFHAKQEHASIINASQHVENLGLEATPQYLPYEAQYKGTIRTKQQPLPVTIWVGKRNLVAYIEYELDYSAMKVRRQPHSSA